MDDESRESVEDLARSVSVASLGTIHDGEPAVSMVPFALSQDGTAIYVHVSRLARHTADMIRAPRVALMIMESESTGTSSLALARLSMEGEAREIAHDSSEYMSARAAYIERHPEAEPMFGFADFSLFAISLESGRFVGGFARAFDLSAEALAEVLREHDDA